MTPAKTIPADPFGNIPDLNAPYAGTVLETSAEREAGKRRAAELSLLAAKDGDPR